MTRLKESDMYNWKRMGAFRESLVSNSSNSGIISNDKPQTRKQFLKDAVEFINQIGKDVDLGSDGLFDTIKHQNKVLKDVLTGKKELRASQLAAKQSQEVNHVIDRLITLKNNGILSEEDFTRKVTEAAGF
ncbi:hypothetical protein BWQ96_06083 [Gracilariopsis chorda]|uniref:SHOCT domain-containing protein n=1 Tax=Gracilariopsis chorda TaxID=448386 RepID=A0A2V3IPZ8_9FLOR|nr:hypothetical protein BWQ96_06083 [Gracilariopsis chorda]|eukprot:PXF44156.1 hypothetical protein BWQ96_06083 [Gracilariopsis chorda]